MKKSQLNSIIKKKSSELGFNLTGFTSPEYIKNDYLDQWLGLNYHASMKWMETKKNQRKDIFKYFPKVKTIVSFAYNYYTESNDNRSSDYKIWTS